MNPLAAVPVALTALRVNALRSFLAILGVIIGVAAVIATVSLAQGARAAVEAQIASLGSNMLMVRPASSNTGGRRGGAGSATLLSSHEAAAMRERLPFVVAAAGTVQTRGTAVAAGVNWPTELLGAHPDYFEVRDWFVDEGRAFTAAEDARSARVAVIGRTVAEELFPNGAPVGASVRIEGTPFEVVGVMSERGQSSWGQDQDDVILMPVSTLRDRIFRISQPGVRDPVTAIWVEVAGDEDMADAQAEIEEFLRLARDVDPGDEDNFRVLNFADFIRARNETESVLGVLLAGVGVITLVVGGIGIMNIMLVSVTERTREIGLRLAVGAPRRAIRDQFLVEAVTLCTVGGLLGLAAGMGGAFALQTAASQMLGIDDLSVSVNPAIALLAIAASTAVGVIFGFYPAHRASRLNPIEALRHE